MKLIIVFFLALFGIAQSQNFELTDKQLIKYYELTNKAESKIINNDLIEASRLYKDAFKEFKYPHAKDLYNSMKVALKNNDLETAYALYQSLKCLGKDFDNDFLAENFKKIEKYKTSTCKKAIDLVYKKTLDSLFEIDQYYRKLSKGNYSAYKKEITKGDSITSTHLLKLIEKKGFPNEYNIGLGSTTEMFYQKFYYIIWHQLATNNISNQKVNFSTEIAKALNQGKIRPDIAGQLLDLNNGTYNYSFFKIYQFITNGGKTYDCCYISEAFLPEKRTEKTNTTIININKKRKQIGLSTTEDEVQKNIFYLNNKDYIFTSITIEGFSFKNDSDAELLKKNVIKLNNILH